MTVLYASLARRLERIVRLGVAAPDPVIEDACQFAWSRLLHHRHRVCPDTVLSWLSTTAVREAFKLSRRDQREQSLDAVLEHVGDAGLPSPDAELEDLVRRNEMLALVRDLPARQQRLVWLHAIGFTYDEMARHEGCTGRTVERQLLRAKRAVRAAAGE